MVGSPSAVPVATSQEHDAHVDRVTRALTASRGRPRLVMVVANGVEGDSRVQKSAAAARAAGYEVVVVGLAHRHCPGPAVVAGATVLRVHPDYPLHERLTRATEARERRLVVLRARSRSAAIQLRATTVRRPDRRHDGTVRVLDRVVAHYQRYTSAGERYLVAGSVVVRLRRAMGAIGGRVWAAVVRRRGWRWTWPLFVDYQNAFTPVVVSLRPDIIHAHDIHLAHVADLAVGVLRLEGHECRWLYDAHEWIDGVPHNTWRQAHATRALEADLIRRADRVLTVSEQLAERLRRRYRLAEDPAVIANAPDSRRVAAVDRGTLRTELGIDRGTPLLVYSGAVAARRGVLTVLHALPQLPGVHFAVVTDERARFLGQMRAEAERLGVSERFHARPYVPAESVTWYLCDADAGLAPFLRTPSHDLALATKVREYIHAGLPVVGSDCVVMAEFLVATGIGEVFRAGDVGDFVRAVRAFLCDPGRYSSRITPELRAGHSWENEAAKLVSCYEELLPQTAPRPLVLSSATAHQREGSETSVGVRHRNERALIGPLDVAGRASRWLDALRAVRADAAVDLAVEAEEPDGREDVGSPDGVEGAGDSFVCEVPMGSPVVEVPSRRTELIVGLRVFREVADNYSRVLIEIPATLLGAVSGGEMSREFEYLHRAGIEVSYILHADHPREADAAAVSRGRAARALRRMIEEYGVRILVTSPTLLLERTGATWVPVLPSVAVPSLGADPLPHVVRIAGSGDPGATSVVAGLAAAGVCRFTTIGSNRSDDPALQDADVLLDRRDLGTYSDAAVTAMAGGAVVLGSVRPEVRDVVGQRIPVLDVTDDTLAETLTTVLHDTAMRQDLGKSAREYVAAVHSVAAVADALGVRL